MNQFTRSIRFLAATMLVALLTVAIGAPAAAETEEGMLEKMIALEKSKLDPWYGKASVDGYVAEVADDATLFDPWAPKKLVGDEVREYLRGFEGLIPHVDYEITDPAADVRGDIVVFTFHIEGTDLDTGEAITRWNVTKVLNRTADGWEMIHEHFSLPAPPTETEA